MSAAGSIPPNAPGGANTGLVYALEGAPSTSTNLNATAIAPEAYGAALGNNKDIISVNDPLALANFLPGPPPPAIIQVPTTPVWAYFVGAGVLLAMVFKKRII